MELFPLPLAPFERLMLLDDRPGQPMTFFGELTFTGEMRPDALHWAAEQALARHPLLGACVAARGRDWYWMPADTPAPLDVRQDQSPIMAEPNGAIDLHREPGVRLWARAGAGQTYLLLQFHHACCDGRGAMRFVEDILLAYAAHVAGAKPDFDRLDRAQLRQRSTFRLPKTTSTTNASANLWRQLRDAYRFHTQRPALLAQPGAVPSGQLANPAFPGTQTHFFTGEEAAAIERAVAACGTTLNDVAMTLLLLTVAEWNQQFAPRDLRRWLRILLPTDLRDRSDLRLPAANRMSLYFLTRRTEDCRSFEELLAGIHCEMQSVKLARVGLDFLMAIGLLQNIPGALSAVLDWPRSLATVLLTNMSDPTRRFRRKLPHDQGRLIIGNVTLNTITGSPPLRPGTGAGFGIGTYAGQIMLNLKCDPRLFTADDTQQLLQALVATWRKWLLTRC